MGPKIFPLSGKFFRKTEKAQKFLEIFIFSIIKNFLMIKNSKKIKKHKRKKEKKIL
jgi:hypothetical protein